MWKTDQTVLADAALCENKRHDSVFIHRVQNIIHVFKIFMEYHNKVASQNSASLQK